MNSNYQKFYQKQTFSFRATLREFCASQQRKGFQWILIDNNFLESVIDGVWLAGQIKKEKVNVKAQSKTR